MSFGVSVSDVVTLVQLTTRTYNGWKKACGQYAIITTDLKVLQILLRRVEKETKAPTSLLARNPADVKGWTTLSESCRSTVVELEGVLSKYKSLSTNRRKNWDKIRMGNEDVNGLGIKLAQRVSSLAAFLSVIGISSQGRLENEAFPQLLQKIDHLAAQIRKGNGTVSTAWTEYEDDDKATWREVRRDMINGGIRSRDIHKYSAALRTYLSRLQREGLLDEKDPLGRSAEE